MPAGHFDGISSFCSKVKKPDFGEIDQINYVFGLLVQSKCVFFLSLFLKFLDDETFKMLSVVVI